MSSNTWQWISAKQYAKETGMGYATVLKLCRNGTLDCVETDGGNCHKKFFVKYDPNAGNTILTQKQREIDELKKRNVQLESIVQNILVTKNKQGSDINDFKSI